MLTRTKNVRWPCGPAMDCTRPSTITTSPSYHPLASLRVVCRDRTLLEGAEQSVTPAHAQTASVCHATRTMATANGFMIANSDKNNRLITICSSNEREGGGVVVANTPGLSQALRSWATECGCCSPEFVIVLVACLRQL